MPRMVDNAKSTEHDLTIFAIQTKIKQDGKYGRQKKQISKGKVLFKFFRMMSTFVKVFRCMFELSRIVHRLEIFRQFVDCHLGFLGIIIHFAFWDEEPFILLFCRRCM